MKRMNFLIVILAVFALILASGCSQKYLARNAFHLPEDAISAKHPNEFKKDFKRVTIFNSVMDPGNWTEVYNGGGVWPVLAMTKDKKIVRSYNFLTDLNYWGDFICLNVFPDLEEGKIISLNRDGWKVYDVEGREHDYDPKKFDEDPKYREEIFNKFGTDLGEIDRFWKNYTRKRGIEADPAFQFTKKIEIGSPDWETFLKKFEERMSHKYVMPNGEVRAGYFPVDEFRHEAVQNHGVTTGQRFRKNLKIPVASLNPIMAAAGVGGSLLSAIIAANVDDDWTGYYQRAQALRADFKPLFRQVCEMYKMLLQQRDLVIYELQQGKR